MNLRKVAKHINGVWNDDVICVIDKHTICLAPHEQAVTIYIEDGIVTFPTETKLNLDLLEILVAFVKGVKDEFL